MTTEGHFITLITADTYLINDYEYSLRISSIDFSFIANTPLFEGNILRFRALASIEIVRYDLNFDKISDALDMKDIYYYLTNSIASLENSFNIYEAKEVMAEFEKNHYGMALALYTLGYIYKTFSQELSKDCGIYKEEYVQNNS